MGPEILSPIGVDKGVAQTPEPLAEKREKMGLLGMLTVRPGEERGGGFPTERKARTDLGPE